MRVQPLCIEPDPLLRLPSLPVEAFTEELRILVEDMIGTMRANNGIGIAAPQVGQLVQLFVANPSRRAGAELVVVNPKLEKLKGRVTVTEGCLSVPGFWADVKRAEKVRLRGQDLSGRTIELEAEGMLAIVLQHELDHLQGKLFVDRLSWYRRRFLRRRFTSLS